MTAFYHISLVTDLVRKNHEPLIKEPFKDLCSGLEDYAMSAYIRYLGIKMDYPTAEWVADGSTFSVYVDGVEVYRKELVYIDPELVMVSDEDGLGENE